MIEENSWNHRLVTVPIILFTMLFIAWTVFTEVDEVVRGAGKVIPSSQTKVLQNLEGGIVEEIFVKEGQKVKVGDPIYKLKNATSQANSKKKEISLLAYKAQRQRLSAQIAFKKDIDDALNEGEKNIFKQEMQNFQDELSTLKDRLKQSKLEKKQKSFRLANLRTELKTANENLAIVEKLVKKGAASKTQYLAELSKKQSLVTDITDIKNSIPIMIEKISESLNS